MKQILIVSSLLCFMLPLFAQQEMGRESFNNDWRFHLGQEPAAMQEDYKDDKWKKLNLPHDWSIELPFDKNSPAGISGGALNGGIGWYRKEFTLHEKWEGRKYYIDFDGVYMNSEVFLNGHSLGVRPNGYISFRYDLTPYLKPAGQKNILAVKVDNSRQPNSRWYSGSGIYRNVWLIKKADQHVSHWGTSVTTPRVTEKEAFVRIKTSIENHAPVTNELLIETVVKDPAGKQIAVRKEKKKVEARGSVELDQQVSVSHPNLWSLEKPKLYQVITRVIFEGKTLDEYITPFGIRYFHFDVKEGFSLNGKKMKLRGVCLHHDLGALGAAFNTSAMERQLRIMKEMGCNSIRTSHNPPAPELLDLCDKMGLVVMDEAFDMWKKKKSEFDYHLYWDEWHERDLEDFIVRDRNHPSVMIWSVGNEISEQWGENNDSLGTVLMRELYSKVKAIDSTRPVLTANNETGKQNRLLQSGAYDLIGYNYHVEDWLNASSQWGSKPFIVTESVSSLHTRGHYDMPSDSIRIWPVRWDIPFTAGNPGNTTSAYDNCKAPWGSTHQASLFALENNPSVSGMYVWTGFDYMGEPTPYLWPSRSSYFGIVDMAGFPKDVYYLYQSVWTIKPVLHVFPHWNWKAGQEVDVWAYYNQADEVELFLNGRSQGVKRKSDSVYHVSWRVKYEPGTITCVSRKQGKTVLTRSVHSAGVADHIKLVAEKKVINAKASELAFVQVRIVDAKGNLVPDAEHAVKFELQGPGEIAGVDNGLQTSMESFKGNTRKAFNGLCLVIIRAKSVKGSIKVKATSNGLKTAETIINIQ